MYQRCTAVAETRMGSCRSRRSRPGSRLHRLRKLWRSSSSRWRKTRTRSTPTWSIRYSVLCTVHGNYGCSQRTWLAQAGGQKTEPTWSIRYGVLCTVHGNYGCGQRTWLAQAGGQKTEPTWSIGYSVLCTVHGNYGWGQRTWLAQAGGQKPEPGQLQHEASGMVCFVHSSLSVAPTALLV